VTCDVTFGFAITSGCRQWLQRKQWNYFLQLHQIEAANILKMKLLGIKGKLGVRVIKNVGGRR